MSHANNAGMENDTFALQLFCEMAASGSEGQDHSPAIIQAHKHTIQLSREPGPQSQIQASTGSTHEDFNCIWVLIHAIHNAKGLSNVKSLAKSSKNIFI